MDRDAYVHFFFGTPKRTIWTLIVIFMVFWLLFPEPVDAVLLALLGRVGYALQPLLQPLALILTVIGGFWVLLRPLPKKEKKSKH